MVYLTHIPAPPVSEFVEYLWSLRDAPPHARERILPTGTLELVVNLHEDEFRIYDPGDVERYRRLSATIVSGAYRGFFVIDTLEQASVIGVHFRPGGAFPFLGPSPGALADAHHDLGALWGPTAARLRERLCVATSPEQRFSVLEDALSARLSRVRPSRSFELRRRVVQAALQPLGRPRTRISDVATRIGMSHRRFVQLFTDAVGMTPKLFSRVQRFQRVAALARRNASPDWGPLALASGYFDQSHLIRDFVALSGLTPVEFLRHHGERVKENHVALQGWSSSSNTR